MKFDGRRAIFMKEGSAGEEKVEGNALSIMRGG